MRTVVDTYTYRRRDGRTVTVPEHDRVSLTVWTPDAILEAIREWAEKHGRAPKSTEWKKAGFGHPNHAVVKEAFGSFSAAVRAAGLEPYPHHGPGPTWTRERIIGAFLDELFRRGRWPKMNEWRSADPRGRRPTAQTVRQAFGSWNAAKIAAGANKRSVRRANRRPIRSTPIRRSDRS